MARSLVLLLALTPLGCDAIWNPSGLSNAYDSPEALAEAVLAAVEQNDRGALEALMVTADEHRELLWGQLPESNDLEFEFARAMNEHNSRKGMGAILAEYGGTAFQLVSIEFTEDPEVYEGFTLHFGPRLLVRRVSDGREGLLPILDVVLERQGRWKLMNYDEM